MFFGGKSFNPDKDIPDLSGKVIIVTGGNIGLGQESVLQYAKHNPARVYLAARTESKAQQAIDEIKKEVPNANVSFMQLDLSSFQSISEAVKAFNEKESRLDILMNNAGVMALAPGTTKEGYEIQFGTNHMGHFLLTKLLLPTLTKTATEHPESDVRIINLSSEGHNLAMESRVNNWPFEIYTTSMDKHNTWTRYGHSKLANILFSRELSRRYPNIKSIAVHPGVVNTNLMTSYKEKHPYIFGVTGWMLPMFFKGVPEGTKNQLWCSVSKDAKTGTYYTPVGNEGGESKVAKDQDGILAGKLWEYSEKEVAKHGY